MWPIHPLGSTQTRAQPEANPVHLAGHTLRAPGMESSRAQPPPNCGEEWWWEVGGELLEGGPLRRGGSTASRSGLLAGSLQGH